MTKLKAMICYSAGVTVMPSAQLPLMKQIAAKRRTDILFIINT